MTHELEYGYFAIMRVKGGVFHKADGTTETFEDYNKAINARKEWLEKEHLPKVLEATREAREKFRSECTIHERRVKQQGFLNPDRVYSDICGPDGRVLGQVVGDNQATQIEEYAAEHHPDPTLESVAADQEAKVTEKVMWAAATYLGGQYKRLPAFEDWAFGLPLEKILSILNNLASEGWSVAQVSEDRGIYAGTTNATDSAVTKARYLLVREP
jgi:hypothetical protein